MPTITKALLKRIQQMLAEHPLRGGEYRRIPKMGSHYISLESSFQDQKPLFTIQLDGQTYHIFRSTSN